MDLIGKQDSQSVSPLKKRKTRTTRWIWNDGIDVMQMSFNFITTVLLWFTYRFCSFFFLHLISEILKRGWSKVFHFFFVQFTWICKVKLYNDSVCLRIPMVPSHLIVCFPLQMFYNFWIRWFDSLWLLVFVYLYVSWWKICETWFL